MLAGQIEKNLQHDPTVNAGTNVIDDDSGALGQLLQATDRRGLGDVEGAKEQESQQHRNEMHGSRDEGDELTRDFIDDDMRRIFASTAAGFKGCGRNPNNNRDRGEYKD